MTATCNLRNLTPFLVMIMQPAPAGAFKQFKASFKQRAHGIRKRHPLPRHLPDMPATIPRASSPHTVPLWSYRLHALFRGREGACGQGRKRHGCDDVCAVPEGCLCEDKAWVFAYQALCFREDLERELKARSCCGKFDTRTSSEAKPERRERGVRRLPSRG